MKRAFLEYLSGAFPEGVFLRHAPQNCDLPYLVVTPSSHELDAGLSPECCLSATDVFHVDVYAWTDDSAELLVERLREVADRPGEVFEMWDFFVGRMVSVNADDEEYLVSEGGETTVVRRGLDISIHYQRRS